MHPDDCENFTPDHSKDLLEQLFTELFREYEHPLYLFAFKMLKSEAAARDIVQEVFLKLWLIRDNISEIRSISAFLYKLTENKVIDHLRSAAVSEKTREALWRKLQNQNEPDPTAETENREYHVIIRQAIEQLPAQRKSVYLLSQYEDRPRKEIAALLKISPHTVKNHLARAIEGIVSHLKRHSE